MAMRVIRASNDAIRRAWHNGEQTLTEAASGLGMSPDALRDRAMGLGLSPRRGGRREVIRPHQEAGFSALWQSGVSAREIGAHFGCSYYAVINTAQRLGLTMRGAGFRPRLRLADWQQDQLGAALARAAQTIRRRQQARANADRACLKEAAQ